MPATWARTDPPVSATVQIAEIPIHPFLGEGCGFPKEIQIIGASTFRTVLVAGRQVMNLVVEWAACTQVLPFLHQFILASGARQRTKWQPAHTILRQLPLMILHHKR